ncbi:MAG: hypothetical protein KGL13_04580, partial [Gammaproteobacteria bacterium]|nr:hypothetical protein [Gammaproteobacteria bacterium]
MCKPEFWIYIPDHWLAAIRQSQLLKGAHFAGTGCKKRPAKAGREAGEVCRSGTPAGRVAGAGLVGGGAITGLVDAEFFAIR